MTLEFFGNGFAIFIDILPGKFEFGSHGSIVKRLLKNCNFDLGC